VAVEVAVIVGGELRIARELAGEHAARQRDPRQNPNPPLPGLLEEQVRGPVAETVEDDLHRLHIGKLDGFQSFLDALHAHAVVTDLARLHQAVERAESLLAMLGALSPGDSQSGSDITPIGRQMLRLPMHPRYSRMQVEAARLGCVPSAALCAALVSERDLLARLGRDDKHIAEARELFEASAQSDFFTLMRAFQFARNNHFNVEQCRRYGVRAQTARQAEQTFQQFLQLAGHRSNEDSTETLAAGGDDAGRVVGAGDTAGGVGSTLVQESDTESSLVTRTDHFPEVTPIEAPRSSLPPRPYFSLADFVERTRTSVEITENLVRVGAFDTLGTRREELLAQLPILYAGISRRTSAGGASRPAAARDRPARDAGREAEAESSVDEALRLVADELPSLSFLPSWSLEDRVRAELNVLGLNVSAHPLAFLRNQLYGETRDAQYLSAEYADAQTDARRAKEPVHRDCRGNAQKEQRTHQ